MEKEPKIEWQKRRLRQDHPILGKVVTRFSTCRRFKVQRYPEVTNEWLAMRFIEGFWRVVSRHTGEKAAMRAAVRKWR